MRKIFDCDQLILTIQPTYQLHLYNCRLNLTCSTNSKVWGIIKPTRIRLKSAIVENTTNNEINRSTAEHDRVFAE